MVKSAQKRFFKSLFLLLFPLFIITFLSTCGIVNYFSIRTITQDLNNAQTIFLNNEQATPPPNSMYLQLRVEGNDVYCINQSLDEITFSNFDLDNFINEISGKIQAINNGKLGNIYYKTIKTSNEYKLFALDATFILESKNSTIITALVIYLISFSMIYSILCLCSLKIFQPILDASNRQKQFISDASHELKTPLAIISANAEVLKSDNDEKWLNNIQDQTKRMEVLVEDMLSMAKMEEEQIILKPENFDVSEEVINTVLPYEAIGFEKQKRIITNVQEGLRVTADRTSLKKVLEILMDNALKYAKENGTIEIGLKKHKHRIVLWVKNDGSNVPDKDSSKIFERFYRAEDSRSREYGGSGLGLAIAKNIAVTNKWKIFAKSQYKKSMTITLFI